MNFEKRIQMCRKITPLESKIANFIMKEKQEVLDLSIQELADRLFVSKSAIHRLCKKLDFQGFNDLKVQIAQDLANRMSMDSSIDVNYPFQKEDNAKEIAYKLMKLYEVTMKDTFDLIQLDELQKIAEILHNAKVIDIYTHSHNLNAAENFQDKMLTIGRIVNCPKSFYRQRMNVLASTPSHVAIILSYSGRASFIMPIVKMLYEKQVPIIMMGKCGKTQYVEYISYHIGISDKEHLRNRISQYSSHIAVQYMLDVLYGCIYNIDHEKNMAYLRQEIAYMDDRKIDFDDNNIQ